MERDRLKYTISRFDHYFESINNKIALYIALNTFIVGSILAGYSSIIKDFKRCLCLFNTMTSILLLLGLFTLISLVRASLPYISKKPTSLIYFDSISSIPKKEFIDLSKNCSDKDELKDLRNQVSILSNGLSAKYKRLKICGQLLIIQFLILVPLFIIFIINKF
ncbi:hypothetical protein HER15_08000 [Tenacibaculum mesophilum]|uniref:Pycsar effector protein domain-containing protein n=1 Tax=Tenacibaculum mesophilum TaxID=104268 RepID=A0AAE9MPJ9_9FLAO|nr:Pycsar system effector family protein [Tenacibaculum mesophilum]UTD15410.1 hypothetical protein HER15_08000 [Tenacibaculum mesophilum]